MYKGIDGYVQKDKYVFEYIYVTLRLYGLKYFNGDWLNFLHRISQIYLQSISDSRISTC